MNRFSFKFLGWAVVASVLFFSCEKTEEGGEELVPQKTVKCLVVNQGNYSDANGGISVLYSVLLCLTDLIVVILYLSSSIFCISCN